MRQFFVYILAKHRHGALYVGVTNDLVRRTHEHRQGLVPGFTKRHGIKQLVYFKTHAEVRPAIEREKTIKRWPRAWKIRTIEKMNPSWKDLYEDICGKALLDPGHY